MRRAGAMRTVYIDIYFLINFTVDLLAFHLAVLFTRAHVVNSRLILASFISSIFACTTLFFELKAWMMTVLSLVMLLLISYVLIGGISIQRRIRIMVAFVLFLTIIGGLVYLAFDVIGAYFPDQVAATVENRRLLVLSMLLLLSIGIFRLLFLFFYHSTTERVAHLKIELLGNSVECDALVDSGNLLKDPIDLTPVMMIKSDIAKRLFPQGIPSCDSSNISGFECFVRLIPVKKDGRVDLKLGVRAERVLILRGKRYEEIKATFIIDEEEGRFGGYEALLPASALEST